MNGLRLVTISAVVDTSDHDSQQIASELAARVDQHPEVVSVSVERYSAPAEQTNDPETH